MCLKVARPPARLPAWRPVRPECSVQPTNLHHVGLFLPESILLAARMSAKKEETGNGHYLERNELNRNRLKSYFRTRTPKLTGNAASHFRLKILMNAQNGLILQLKQWPIQPVHLVVWPAVGWREYENQDLLHR